LVPCRTVEEAVRSSAVVVSATGIYPNPQPQVKDEWVEPGAFLAPIDFDSFWETRTFFRARRFIVDSLDEMEYFKRAGYFSNGLPHVYAETGEIVAGLKAGREHGDEFIVAMNMGMGVVDVVVANELFRRALEMGVGQNLVL
jgi:ornithine cyclodeaminase/alanine dehydrogenase